MILMKLFVYSQEDKKIFKEYKFNSYGLNIILGEKRSSADETNGVGKTTMVECIEFLLGKSITKAYSANSIIADKDLFLVLKIEINDEILFLGRVLNNSKKGFILREPMLSFNLSTWEELNIKEYKQKVESLITGEDSSDVPFTGLREYIIRDEKSGFNNTILMGREAIKNHMYLAYLFGLPYDSEIKINEHKKEIEKYKQQIKLIEATSEKRAALKFKEEELKKEILDIDEIIKSIDVTKHYNLSTAVYTDLKTRLNKIQKEIFELEHICAQYEKNISNLHAKTEGIKELKDVKPFYEQLLSYFPEKIEKNYEEIEAFYEFMVENRGAYFEGKILTLRDKLKKLHQEKEKLEDDLKRTSEIFKNKKFIDDISVIVKEREKMQMELAEVKVRILDYDKKNEINNKINELEREKLRITSIMDDKFNIYKEHIEKLDGIFNELMSETYNQVGVLNFEHENSARGNVATGRIKISCSIPDEKSHGRLYMKINMFDLTWLINRVESCLPINFLIHDGSYAKPDSAVKYRLLNYMDSKLKRFKKGQYFVTINVDELLDEDLKKLFDSNAVVAKLDRNDDENRFFGFKY